jgi:hypothetical protein
MPDHIFWSMAAKQKFGRSLGRPLRRIATRRAKFGTEQIFKKGHPIPNLVTAFVFKVFGVCYISPFYLFDHSTNICIFFDTTPG